MAKILTSQTSSYGLSNCPDQFRRLDPAIGVGGKHRCDAIFSDHDHLGSDFGLLLCRVGAQKSCDLLTFERSRAHADPVAARHSFAPSNKGRAVVGRVLQGEIDKGPHPSLQSLPRIADLCVDALMP